MAQKLMDPDPKHWLIVRTKTALNTLKHVKTIASAVSGFLS
jgi:hypothetical protein